jgi:hypothetical protein
MNFFFVLCLFALFFVFVLMDLRALFACCNGRLSRSILYVNDLTFHAVSCLLSRVFTIRLFILSSDIDSAAERHVDVSAR